MNSCKLIPINAIETPGSGEPFRSDPVLAQVQKIISHPLFSRCKILQEILLYVIHETLAGRTNMIKEYTIAINVLHKPVEFNVDKTSIVRIHARRLRHHLGKYYKEAGVKDNIVISIPKGGYVPVFLKAATPVLKSMRDLSAIHVKEDPDPVVLAVIPFKTYEKRISRIAFCDSLGQNICMEINRMKRMSVISYHAIRKLSSEKTDIKSLANDLDVNYVLTGDVHFGGEIIKVYVQLTETTRQTQVWSEVYQFNSTSFSFFKLSDYVTSKITESIGSLNIGPRQGQSIYIQTVKEASK